MNAHHRPSLNAAGLFLGLLLTASCVSQQEYDEAVDLAKHYQTRLHDSEQAQQALEAERDRLRRDLALSKVQAGDPGYADYESRISELQRRIDGLGGNLKDVEYLYLDDGSYVVLVQDQILFASGSAEISAAGRQRLGTIASQIQRNAHGRVLVRGHTDSDPVSKPETKKRFPHGNLELSAARAIEVAAALQQNGVPARDVAVMGFGPYEPLRDNSSAENKRLNRRVEIFVAKAEGRP
jgi:flagellar motor protein MotB